MKEVSLGTESSEKILHMSQCVRAEETATYGDFIRLIYRKHFARLSSRGVQTVIEA